MDISNKKIVIATHYLVYGAPQALREYLINKNIKELLFIGHPLKTDESKSYQEINQNGVPTYNAASTLRTRISIFNYAIEFLLTLYWVLSKKTQYDLYIGVDPLNACAGVLLKKMRRIKKLVYYTIDYVPERFSNKYLNDFYHWLDKLCLSNADETWNVSPRIAEGREKVRGLKKSVYKKQKVVPIGIWFDRIKRLPFEKIKKHQLLFIGHLLEKQGVQIVLEAIPTIIKSIRDFHFLIVGGGEYESKLKIKIKKLKIDNYVTMTGWVKDREKLDAVMSDSALAIAMYDKKLDTFTYYADPTKLKDYLSAGLPILLTDLPYNAHEIEKNKCGLIIDYNAKVVASSVISLLRKSKTLQDYRKNEIGRAHV